MRARLVAHFLPKFDNQSEDVRLTGGHPDACRCLLVSKKHSGSLVMAPPFYSKNGCANKYSRLGELILREHFRAVWPDERPDEREVRREHRGVIGANGAHGSLPPAQRRVGRTRADERDAR